MGKPIVVVAALTSALAALLALAVLDGALHAIGGGLDKTSVERYDPRANRWSVVPRMALPEDMPWFAAAVRYD